MAAEFDLIIRGGTVVDGTGRAPIEADVGIKGNRIAAIGTLAKNGAEEIDAKGKLVTPGFVDIHTHYDGQAVWDSRMTPSSMHGVTTAVMGNCGVGFAPCKPADREKLVELMEGVEDIPGAVMHEGLKWEWESFSEYLAALERRNRDIDLCALLPQCACSGWAIARSRWRTPTRPTSRRCARSPPMRCAPARSVFPPRAA
jgi:N-acyl-D-aspartate/D-glutamate deacylase